MTALAVASLAVVSVGAMVVSSELLVDTVDRPARRRLDPLVLDLGPVGTVQAELPRDARGPQPPRRRPPTAAPPPQRQPAGPAPAERDDDDGVVLVAQHTVVKKVVVVVRRPALRPAPRPAPPVAAPPGPPERPAPVRQWRRWAPRRLPPPVRVRPPSLERPHHRRLLPPDPPCARDDRRWDHDHGDHDEDHRDPRDRDGAWHRDRDGQHDDQDRGDRAHHRDGDRHRGRWEGDHGRDRHHGQAGEAERDRGRDRVGGDREARRWSDRDDHREAR